MAVATRKPLLAAGGCAVALVLLVAVAYSWGPIERLDAKTLTGLGQLGDNGQAALPHTFANSVDPFFLLCVLGVHCIAGLAWGRPRHVAAAVAVVAGANITAQLLKVALAHPRVQPELKGTMEAAALPSGHATAAMSLAVAAILIVPRPLRIPAAVAGALFALAQGVAVVVLAWHYPSDVVSGYLLATGFGFLALAGLRASEVRWPRSASERDGAAIGPMRSASAIGFAAFAGVLIAVASARADDLLAYARDHTLGMAAALAIAMAASCLAAWLALATEE
jgi:membrane-associated phospholipid phosphatase